MRRCLLALLILGAGCPAPTAAPVSHPPGDAGLPQTPLTRRLSVKIATLIAVREEIQAARAGLGAEEAEGALLLQRLDALKAARGAPAVTAALAEAAAAVAAASSTAPTGGPLAPRLQLARLEARARPLLAEEADDDDAPRAARALQAELRRQQAALAPLVAAARVSRQALIRLAELRRAVRLLEESP